MKLPEHKIVMEDFFLESNRDKYPRYCIECGLVVFDTPLSFIFNREISKSICPSCKKGHRSKTFPNNDQVEDLIKKSKTFDEAREAWFLWKSLQTPGKDKSNEF